MAEKILSIIIPMYQAERFIAKCLDSLLTDQRCLTYLEILIVNDGSRDRSGKIAAGYREKYPDSIRLIEKENGGHGSAVNAGVEQCSGKYFKVLDADDWVSPGGLKAVTEKFLVMEEADMVLAGFTIYDMNTKKVRHIRSRQKQGLRYLQMEELGLYAAKINPLSDWETVTMEALVFLGWYEDAKRCEGWLFFCMCFCPAE